MKISGKSGGKYGVNLWRNSGKNENFVNKKVGLWNYFVEKMIKCGIVKKKCEKLSGKKLAILPLRVVSFARYAHRTTMTTIYIEKERKQHGN